MSMISYSQNGEDVVLNRLFPPGHKGLYIDVGANNPLDDTVTRHFYEQGWQGINIEPGAEMHTLIAQNRPKDVNLHVGLSNTTGVKTFYDFPDYPGSSTYCQVEAEVHKRDHGFRCIERNFSVTTLKAVCEAHVTRPIDFISIDVEGHEREVLEGADFHRFRPVAMVLEATRPNTSIPTHQLWEDLLWKAEYRFALFDGLNRYYIRGEDSHLLARMTAPANCLDDFIPYRYLKQVAGLQQKLAYIDGLGPRSIAVARKLNKVAARINRFRWRMRHMVGRAA
jgi:FkbM family methyltransferase